MFLEISEQQKKVNEKTTVINVIAFCLSMSIKKNKHVNSYLGSQQNTLLITNINHPESMLISNFYGLPFTNYSSWHHQVIELFLSS